MTAPTDTAIEAVNAFILAMKQAFNPADAVQPPLGGGSDKVHFVAGDVVPLEMWDSFAQGTNCLEPFLWVRLVRRFRSKVFPAETIDDSNCSLPRVVRIEVGIGRCAVLPRSNGIYDWDQLAVAAEVSMDDSYRIELALCRARSLLINNAVATDTIAPFGPEGGVTAWAGTALVQI